MLLDQLSLRIKKNQTFGDAGASSSNSVPKAVPSKANPSIKRGTFNSCLKTLYEDLMEFNVKGADTRKFLAEKLQKNLPAPMRSTQV
jgi:ubiquitin-conjugating enzyme E2 O